MCREDISEEANLCILCQGGWLTLEKINLAIIFVMEMMTQIASEVLRSFPADDESMIE